MRPHDTGSFGALVQETTRHPAMLVYLDNQRSVGPDSPLGRRKGQGLNENLARELLELHTLGVDGGYSQNDVVEVARAFTGWTTIGRQARLRRTDAKREMAQQAMGVRQEGDFRFAAAIHDADPKTILGQRFPAGGGIEEGERVLDMLSVHPSTARHLARKLAVRFISDEPSEEEDAPGRAQAPARGRRRREPHHRRGARAGAETRRGGDGRAREAGGSRARRRV